MKDVTSEIVLGSTPYDEPCAQLGEPDYELRAVAECRRFIGMLRVKFGAEPVGAKLRVKASAHDFGTYYGVVVEYDPDDVAATMWACAVEAGLPATWEESS